MNQTHYPTNVAVIGGGWAGMAAAVELASRRIPVTVFEAAKVLGGRARRVELRGIALDNGLHILVGAYHETLRLITGVSQQDTRALKRRPLTLHVEPGFRMRAPRLPRPLHMAVALLLSEGLSISEKLAATRFMRAIQKTGFRCDPSLTVHQLLANHAQPENLIEYLWAPLCLSALNTQLSQADGQTFLNVLRDSLAGPRHASDILLPGVDFSALFPEPAAKYVRASGGRVLSGHTVTAIEPDGRMFVIHARCNEKFTHVIVAVGPHRLEQLISSIPELHLPLEQVRRFVYEPIYSVYLQYDPHIRLAEPMTGLRGCLAQWVFDRGQLCGQSGLLAVVISATGPHQSLPHDQLAERVHQELSTRFPLPRPQWHQVIAEKRATFSCVPGLQRPSNVTAVPGLFIAGDYTAGPYPATLEAAVRSGVACARRILKTLEPDMHPGDGPRVRQ